MIMSDYKFETLQLHVGQETPDPATIFDSFLSKISVLQVPLILRFWIYETASGHRKIHAPGFLLSYTN